MLQPDPVIDVPLYVQIATRVRHRIAAGELRKGDMLPSLRAGARRWGVNLHTVRRAYLALETDGLVETEPRRGTRVAAEISPSLADYGQDLAGFVRRMAREAALRFGVGPAELALRLQAADELADQPIFVLECSTSLARSLAEQIGGWSGLDVRPWPLAQAAATPRGWCLGTYYHYTEIRSALGGRQPPPAFFGVAMEEGNLRRLAKAARSAGRLAILGVDADTGAAIASDLGEAIGEDVRIELRVTDRPRAVLDSLLATGPVLLSPENWDRLSVDERSAVGVFPLAVRPVEQDLIRIAAAFGWPAGRRDARREGGTSSRDA